MPRMTSQRLAIVLFVMVALAPIATATASPVDKPLTVDRVVSMCKSGVPETTILAAIDRDHPVFVLDGAPLIWLRSQQISERIILAMLASGPWRPLCQPAPVLVVPHQPTSTRGIFFTQPTRGIFFAPPAATCR